MTKEPEYTRIVPKCKSCEDPKALAELVSVEGKTYCYSCVGKVVPGGLLNIWGQKI